MIRMPIRADDSARANGCPQYSIKYAMRDAAALRASNRLKPAMRYAR